MFTRLLFRNIDSSAFGESKLIRFSFSNTPDSFDLKQIDPTETIDTTQTEPESQEPLPDSLDESALEDATDARTDTAEQETGAQIASAAETAATSGEPVPPTIGDAQQVLKNISSFAHKTGLEFRSGSFGRNASEFVRDAAANGSDVLADFEGFMDTSAQAPEPTEADTTTIDGAATDTTTDDAVDDTATAEEGTDDTTVTEEGTDDTATAEEGTDDGATAEEGTDDTATAEEGTDDTATAEEGTDDGADEGEESGETNEVSPEKLQEWASNIEGRAESLGYDVDIAVEGEALVMEFKGEGAEEDAQYVSDIAAKRGMRPQLEGSTLTVTVDKKLEGLGYFGPDSGNDPEKPNDPDDSFDGGEEEGEEEGAGEEEGEEEGAVEEEETDDTVAESEEAVAEAEKAVAEGEVDGEPTSDLDKNINAARDILNDPNASKGEKFSAAVALLLLALEKASGADSAASSAEKPTDAATDGTTAEKPTDGSDDGKDKEEGDTETETARRERLLGEVEDGGFESVNDLIDDKQEQLDERLAEIDGEIDGLEEEIDGFEEEKDDLEDNKDNLEESVDDMEQELSSMDAAGDDSPEAKTRRKELESGIREAKMEIADIDDDLAALDAKIDRRDDRIDELDAEKEGSDITALRADIDALEEMQDTAQEKVEAMNELLDLSIGELESQVPALDGMREAITVDYDPKTLETRVNIDAEFVTQIESFATDNGVTLDLSSAMTDGKVTDIGAFIKALQPLTEITLDDGEDDGTDDGAPAEGDDTDPDGEDPFATDDSDDTSDDGAPAEGDDTEPDGEDPFATEDDTSTSSVDDTTSVEDPKA